MARCEATGPPSRRASARRVTLLRSRTLAHWVARNGGGDSVLRVSYPDGCGILRQVLQMATDSGFMVDQDGKTVGVYDY